MTMAYELKEPAGKWAQKRGEIDKAVVAFVRKQGRAVMLDEIVEVMELVQGYGEGRTRRSIYRLAAKTEGPRLVRRGVGRYEAAG
jgi:hypothetical protein